MHDPNYQLQNSVSDYQKEYLSNPKNNTVRRILIASVLTLALIVGAVYGSLMWSNSPLSAQDAETTTVSTNSATPLQLDTSLFQDQNALADLYDAVAPSVVSIQVIASASQSSSPFLFPDSDQSPMAGQGSGFIYDNEGHIVTNNHVVEDAEEITVLFTNGFWADAKIVATDPQADLAVIKVTPPDNFDWQPLSLALPDTLRVGHMVIALGNPFGLDSTMTTGIVSALGRGQPIGNSGGPLINLNGEVVGVNFAIQSSVRSNSGVGFTIPISIVRRVVPALIEEGGFRYSFLGISGSQIGPITAKELDLPINQLGVYVATALEDGPAGAAGLRGDTGRGQEGNGDGDIITAIITALRDGKEMDFDVTLVDRPGTPRLAASRSDDEDDDSNERESRPSLRRLTARAAIAIAVDAATEEGVLDGEIVQKIAAPDELDGEEVWVVELSTDTQTATVTVDRSSGDVLEVIVE